jgi:hypothetical protein
MRGQFTAGENCKPSSLAKRIKTGHMPTCNHRWCVAGYGNGLFVRSWYGRNIRNRKAIYSRTTVVWIGIGRVRAVAANEKKKINK